MNGALPPPPPPPPPAPAGPVGAPAGSGPAYCSKCGAALGAADRFCPRCGAPLAAAAGPAAPASAPPVDIRNRVDQDRGLLKKIQLLVPGFRGYRQGEDLREADSVLRLQVADRIHAASLTLQTRRQALTTAGKFDGLVELSQALSDLLRLEGEIRHAEQGYTGISPALRVNLSGQDQLYEYDYGFVLAAQSVVDAVQSLSDPSSDPAAAIGTVREMVARLEQAFKARIQVIQGVKV